MAERTVNRRMGPAGSDDWHAMLDAAESILRDEGYGDLTSRRIAEKIGAKRRLVYYYFQTMEEVIVQAFRIQTGRLFLPESAHRLGDFTSEVLGFPSAQFDDQVDALAPLLLWVQDQDRHVLP